MIAGVDQRLHKPALRSASIQNGLTKTQNYSISISAPMASWLHLISRLANLRLNSNSPSPTHQATNASIITLMNLMYKDITTKQLSAVTDASGTAAQVPMVRAANSAVPILTIAA